MPIQKLKALRLQARKAKNKVGSATLATLIGALEYDQEKGTVIDLSVVASKIRKYRQTALDNAELRPLEVDYAVEAEYLEYVMDELMPNQLTGAELKEIFIKDNCANMKECMMLLKSQYAGQYDGKSASMAAKEYLAK